MSYLRTTGWGRSLLKKFQKTSRSKNKPIHETTHWNIVTGDVVRVIQGPQGGQEGKVLEVIRKQNRIIVDGVNVRKRVEKAVMNDSPGKMVVKPCSLHYSNVMLIDPTTG